MNIVMSRKGSQSQLCKSLRYKQIYYKTNLYSIFIYHCRRMRHPKHNCRMYASQKNKQKLAKFQWNSSRRMHSTCKSC